LKATPVHENAGFVGGFCGSSVSVYVVSQPKVNSNFEPARRDTLTLRIKKGADRRIIRGHDWVFSNELIEIPHSAKNHGGALVHLQNHQGKYLATATFNPKTLIAARIVSRKPLAALSVDWFRNRIEDAMALRDVIFTSPFYRLIYGESDGLPGLVIDRFGDYLVVQVTTAGMELVRENLAVALDDVLRPKGIVWRADDHFRELEGLETRAPLITGSVPAEVELREDELAFSTNLSEGQKTGWYYDQRDNRLRLHKYSRGKRVLDVFSYAGGWAVHALKAGATSATCLDRSESALTAATNNAIRNGVAVTTICGEAFAELRKLVDAGKRFDIVVVDPPALIKRKKDFEAGLQAYFQLNRLAAQLLSSSGLLVSCSCSHHLPEENLWEVVQHAATAAKKNIRITEIGAQSADHPMHPGMPEMTYLKALYAWLSD
jgi:23S rRNA (cytosine1962-C5)-methyltransferase